MFNSQMNKYLAHGAYGTAYSDSPTVPNQNWYQQSVNFNAQGGGSDSSQSHSKLNQGLERSGPYNNARDTHSQSNIPFNVHNVQSPAHLSYPSQDVQSNLPLSPAFNMQMNAIQSMYSNFPMTPVQIDASGVDRFMPASIGRQHEDALSSTFMNILNQGGVPFTPAKLNFNDADTEINATSVGSMGGSVAAKQSKQDISKTQASSVYYEQIEHARNANMSYEKAMYDMGMPYLHYGMPNMYMPVPMPYDMHMQSESTAERTHDTVPLDVSTSYHGNVTNAMEKVASDPSALDISTPHASAQSDGEPDSSTHRDAQSAMYPFPSDMMGYPPAMSNPMMNPHTFFQQFFPSPFGNFFPPAIPPGMVFLPPGFPANSNAPNAANPAIDTEKIASGQPEKSEAPRDTLPMADLQNYMQYMMSQGIPLGPMAYFMPPESFSPFGQMPLESIVFESGAEGGELAESGGDTADEEEKGVETEKVLDKEFFDSCVSSYNAHVEEEKEANTKKDSLFPPLPSTQGVSFESLILLSHTVQSPNRHITVSIFGPDIHSRTEHVVLFKRGYASYFEQVSYAMKPITTVEEDIPKHDVDVQEFSANTTITDAAVLDAEANKTVESESTEKRVIYDNKGRPVTLRQYKINLPSAPGEYEVVAFSSKDANAYMIGKSCPVVVRIDSVDIVHALYAFRNEIWKTYSGFLDRPKLSATLRKDRDPTATNGDKAMLSDMPSISQELQDTLPEEIRASVWGSSNIVPSVTRQEEEGKARKLTKQMLLLEKKTRGIREHEKNRLQIEKLHHSFAVASGVLDLCGKPLPVTTHIENISDMKQFAMMKLHSLVPKKRYIPQVDFSTFAEAEAALRSDDMLHDYTLTNDRDQCPEADMEKVLHQEYRDILSCFATTMQDSDRHSTFSTLRIACQTQIKPLFEQLQFLFSMVKDLRQYPVTTDMSLDDKRLFLAAKQLQVQAVSDTNESGQKFFDTSHWSSSFHVQPAFSFILWTLLNHFRYKLLVLQGYFLLKQIISLKAQVPSATTVLQLWTFKYETTRPTAFNPIEISADSPPNVVLSVLSALHALFYDILSAVEENASVKQVLSPSQQALLALWKIHVNPSTKIFLPTQYELQEAGISVNIPTTVASLHRFFSRNIYYYYKQVVFGGDVTLHLMKDTANEPPSNLDLLAPVHSLLSKVGKELHIYPPNLLPLERIREIGEVFTRLSKSPTSEIFTTTQQAFAKYVQTIPQINSCRSKIMGLLLRKYGQNLVLGTTPLSKMNDNTNVEVYKLLEDCVELKFASFQKSFDINHLWCVMEVHLAFDRKKFFDAVTVQAKLQPLSRAEKPVPYQPTVEESILEDVYDILTHTDLSSVFQSIASPRFVFEKPYNDFYFLKDKSNNVNIYLKRSEPEHPNASQFLKQGKKKKGASLVLSVASLVFAWFLRLNIPCSIDDITQFVQNIYSIRYSLIPSFEVLRSSQHVGVLLMCVFWLLYTGDTLAKDCLQVYQDSNYKISIDSCARAYRNGGCIRKDVIGTMRQRAGIAYALLIAGASEWTVDTGNELYVGNSAMDTRAAVTDTKGERNSDCETKREESDPVENIYFPFIKGITRYQSNSAVSIKHPLEAIWINLQQIPIRKSLPKRAENHSSSTHRSQRYDMNNRHSSTQYHFGRSQVVIQQSDRRKDTSSRDNYRNNTSAYGYTGDNKSHFYDIPAQAPTAPHYSSQITQYPNTFGLQSTGYLHDTYPHLVNVDNSHNLSVSKSYSNRGQDKLEYPTASNTFRGSIPTYGYVTHTAPSPAEALHSQTQSGAATAYDTMYTPYPDARSTHANHTHLSQMSRNIVYNGPSHVASHQYVQNYHPPAGTTNANNIPHMINFRNSNNKHFNSTIPRAETTQYT